jgi:hypothetical protein
VAQLNVNHIVTATDVTDYIAGSSDFSFEMDVLTRISQKGFSCEHSGTYTDPATGKPRQFDIRARMTVGQWRVSLAVEAKNLRPSFPLVAHSVPRNTSEAWHEVIIGRRLGQITNSIPAGVTVDPKSSYGGTVSSVARITPPRAVYQVGTPAGKATDQVGRDTQGAIKTGDGDFFEKANQAIQSVQDLAQEAHTDGNDLKRHLVLPVVVVPDDRIWDVRYDASGRQQGAPTSVNQISLYIGKEYNCGPEHLWLRYRVSHLEIVCISALSAFLDDKFLATATMLFN